MNTKLSVVTAVMVFSAAAAVSEPVAAQSAEPATPGLTRAEVNAQVLQARANGELQPAGEGFLQFARSTGAPPPTRAAIRDEVLQARAQGDLIPAGEGPGAGPVDAYGGSMQIGANVFARNGRH